jgi:phosphocarrier protein FPr
MQILKNLLYKPLSVQLTVTSLNGFHLRPIAKFVNYSKTFKSVITATFNGKTVDAKSVNRLLSLSLERGDTFRLTVQGKDARNAIGSLESLFKELMHTEKEIQSIEKKTFSYSGRALEGDIICSGVAIASTFAYSTQSIVHNNTLTFEEAISQTIEKLSRKYEAEKSSVPDAEIYLAQKELLVSLASKCQSLKSLEEHIYQESKKLENTKLSSKISDYQDILRHVKQSLGEEIRVILPKENSILLADDLLPSEITQISKSGIKGVLLKKTSINSHTAILLRAEGIPSLIADIDLVPLKQSVILDATAGVVILSPNHEDLQKATDLQQKEATQKDQASNKRFEQAVTPLGKRIYVYANVADEKSAHVAKDEGAEGIGLLRSEFLFKSNRPSLEKQTQAYKNIFSLFDDITVRTLDVGGDKALPYIKIPLETNPFLGIRGVRLFNTHSEILEEQLHAIFLASKNKTVKIMFPMVSTVEEFNQAKHIALSVAKRYQLDISNITFGIMVEVPSVLFLIEKFNEVVDFYSIGTNDLTQYLFATERTHPSLKVDELSPVVFMAIEMLLNRTTKPVSICGELASNKDAISKLIELGLERLSVNAKSIAITKETIRHV